MLSSSEVKTKYLTLNPKQDKFIFSESDAVCIKGTWGCGKSLAGLLAANKECEEIPNNLYLIIRKEWVDLRDSTLRDWNDLLGRPIVNNEVKYGNGSILMFRHGDDINALKNANLGGALMVQAEEMTDEDFWFLRGRLRRKEGTRQLRLECNYDGHNWIYKMFNQKKIGELIETNTFDNRANLPEDYIPNLQKLPERLQRIHLYGSDEETEGLVFDEFRQEKHWIDPFPIPDGWDRIVSLDHGATNPTAVLWGAIDYDGTIFIYDEHYEAGKLISHHATEIKRRDNRKVTTWICDPSCHNKTIQRTNGWFSVMDEYRDQGLYFRGGDNTKLAGLNRVNQFFKDGKIKVFKNCENFKDEIDGYKWARIRPGQEKNEPDDVVKRNDHCMDALRYLIMSRPHQSLKSEPRSTDPARPLAIELLEEGIG